MISFLASCAAIPAGKVKLEDYPEVNKSELQTLNLEIKSINFEPDTGGTNFGSTIVNRIQVPSSNSKNKISCAVKIAAMADTPLPRLCIVNYFAAGITLFTIPYYCQHIYQANAYLLSYPSQNSLKGKAININPNQIDLISSQIQVVQSKESSTNFLAQKNKIWQQSEQSQHAIQVGQAQQFQQSEEFQQAQKSMQSQQEKQSGQAAHNYLLTQNNQKIYEGDYFLNEKGELVHLLKTYKLEDKVHEVWSSLWMLSWFVVNPTKYAPTAEYPKDAQKIVESTISESLTRSILNDAISFEECRKDLTLDKKTKSSFLPSSPKKK